MPPKSKKEHRQVARVKDYQICFGTEHGERVLIHLLRTHFFVAPIFVKGDIHETLLREGERNVVLRILTILKTNPMDILRRIEEQEREDTHE